MENGLIFMSLYKFKSSRCSPCNQSTQRRRKVYHCWVSSSPIKRAEHETCKYNVNHHGSAHHQGETKFTSSNAENTKWIRLTTDVKFHKSAYLIFPSNAFMASARSSNTFTVPEPYTPVASSVPLAPHLVNCQIALSHLSTQCGLLSCWPGYLGQWLVGIINTGSALQPTHRHETQLVL